MKILKSRRVAWLVLALSVMVSIVGLGGGHLASQRREALRVFDAGVDDFLAVRFSMDAYLDSCAEYARTMAEEYRLHVNADDEVADNVLSLASVVADEQDLDNRYSAYKDLCNAVESLYTDFHAAQVAETDQSLFSNAYANYQGEVSKLGYDEYHALAEKFNRQCEGFPAEAVSALLGIKPLNPFN